MALGARVAYRPIGASDGGPGQFLRGNENEGERSPRSRSSIQIVTMKHHAAHRNSTAVSVIDAFSPKTRRIRRHAGPRGAVSILVAGWLAASLASPVGASLRNPAPSLGADPAPASTTFGDRRISVPSAGHYYGATFQTMTVDG